MAADDNRKKTPLLFLAIAFGVVVVLTLVGNLRSPIVRKLPVRGAGVTRLCSVAGRLTAVCTDGTMYTWNWGNLQKEATEIQIGTDTVAVMDGGLILSATDDEYLLVTDSSRPDTTWRLGLGAGKTCRILRASPAGRYAAVVLSSSLSAESFKLACVQPHAASIRVIDESITGSGLCLKDIGISDSGALIAAVGEKQKGWVAAVDTAAGRVLWRREFGQSQVLTVVTLSSDARTIYAAGSGRYVYALAADTGDVVKRFDIGRRTTPAPDRQRVTSLALSPDGGLIAAGGQPGSQVWLWDTRTGKQLASMKSGHRTISSTAFSPDSSRLATADYEKRTPIKIWKVQSLR